MVVRSPKPLTTTKYLDINEIKDMWIHNGIRMWIIVSHRSIGKSTAGMNLVAKEWKEQSKKFIWLRSTEEQFKTYAKTSNKAWLELGIYIKDMAFYDVETDEICGVGVGLSNCHVYSSGVFDEYYNLIYDEFIPHISERKIKSVFTIFVNFIKTVERDRLGFNVYLLGNAWTKNNAFFVALKYKYKSGFTHVKGTPILIFCTDEHYYFVANSKGSLANTLAEHEPELQLMMNSGRFSFDDDRCIWSDSLRVDEVFYHFEVYSKRFSFCKISDRIGYIIIDKYNTRADVSTFVMMTSDVVKSAGSGIILTKDKCTQYVETWLNEFINGRLYFNSYETRDEIIKYVNDIKGKILRERKK